MNAETIHNAIAAERRNSECLVLKYGDRLAALPRMEALLLRLVNVPGAEDVGNVNVTGDYLHNERPEVDLFLNKKDTIFPREVVKALHIRLHKTPTSEGIVCKGDVDGISLQIYGYLPESCAIVYETVEVPARMERRAKVVCAGGEGG